MIFKPTTSTSNAPMSSKTAVEPSDFQAHDGDQQCGIICMIVLVSCAEVLPVLVSYANIDKTH